MDSLLPDPLPSAPQGTDSSRLIEIISQTSNDLISLDLDHDIPNMIEHQEDFAFITDMMRDEKAEVGHWVRIGEEFWRREARGKALELMGLGIKALPNTKDHIPLYCMLATYHLSLARKAPKTILPSPRTGRPLVHSQSKLHPESSILDDEAPPRTKEQYWNFAGEALSKASFIDGQDRRVKDAKATLLMARGKLEDASKLFDSILAFEPNHLFALMGRARINFARKAFGPALRAYQQVLKFSPKFLPDPRIGIGLCLWMMNDKNRAKLAWERSIAVNPGPASNNAVLLLGLAHLNASRDATLPGGDEGRLVEHTKATQYISRAFKVDNTLAAAAAALGAATLATHEYDKAIRLGERAIQFADSRVLLSEGHLIIARTLHAQATGRFDEKMSDAVAEYHAAANANPDQLMAVLAIGQAAIQTGELPAAMNQYEMILRRSPKCIEALVSLASCYTHLAFTYKDASDSTNARKSAKEHYDAIIRLFATGKEGTGDKEVNKVVAKSGRIKAAARDPGLFLEVARLWSDEPNLSKSLQAYKEAARIEEEELEQAVEPQLLNNIGVLEYQRRGYKRAEEKFEDALIRAMALEEAEDQKQAVIVAVTYNMGVALEAAGEVEKADAAYKQILSVHPEYVDAKARLALMAMAKQKQEPTNKAHLDLADRYIKESLHSQPKNLELRALYAYFLSETGSARLAKDFSIETLKAHEKHDIYALCTGGMVEYGIARESKDPSKEGQKERMGRFLRTAEYYGKALLLDPHCAFAAQGSAILVAEGFLGTGVETTGSTPALTETAQKAKNSRDALAMLTKVKESVNDASVYINIGHCHSLRDEWDRAIENYETALRKYADGKSVTILLYLARAWYQKANADQSFAHLKMALTKAQAALDIIPGDLSIMYNCALIQQKGIEILIDLPQERRTLVEIKEGLKQNEESLKLFEQLPDGKSSATPYPPNTPNQRTKYGESLARRSVDIIAAQEAYELTEQAKLDRAKQAREAERQRIAEVEATRLAEISRQAEALAEQRRAMREEAEQWALSKAFADSDEEDKKKKSEKRDKKRKVKSKGEDGGDVSSGEEDKPKPKKKKAKAPKSTATEGVEGVEGGERGMEVDSDEDEPVRSKRKTGRGGRAFKSNEYIDSDEDSDA